VCSGGGAKQRWRADGAASVVVEVEVAQVKDASWRLAGAQARRSDGVEALVAGRGGVLASAQSSDGVETAPRP
jgi:hypothetical protein